MPLLDTALVSLEEAAAELRLGDDLRPQLLKAINEATEIIEAWCARPLKARAFSGVRMTGPPSTVLRPRWPLGGPIDLTQPIAVTVGGAVQTVWRSEADGDPAGFNVIAQPDQLYRAAGWCGACTPSNPFNVLLSFTGGYDPVPHDLKRACHYVIQRIFAADQVHALTDVSSQSSPGGSTSYAPRGFVMPGQAQDILRWYEQKSVNGL